MSLSILLAIGLGIVALTFVVAPLYQRSIEATDVATQPNSAVAPKTSVVQAATEREQAAKSALQEIELDYQLGNISEEDYNTLRERYMRRALVALKSRHDKGLDVAVAETTYDRDKELDDLIEEQLRKLKEQDIDAME
ncbi:MAG: hypothetical protein NVS4B12_09830 [Ktedonobacteraceae bacterium]